MKKAALASAIVSLLCLASANAFATPRVGQDAAKVTPDMIQTGSDIPAKWSRPEGNFDYVRREVMIPMRDGVKLHTVIMIPKGAHGLLLREKDQGGHHGREQVRDDHGVPGGDRRAHVHPRHRGCGGHGVRDVQAHLQSGACGEHGAYAQAAAEHQQAYAEDTDRDPEKFVGRRDSAVRSRMGVRRETHDLCGRQRRAGHDRADRAGDGGRGRPHGSHCVSQRPARCSAPVPARYSHKQDL